MKITKHILMKKLHQKTTTNVQILNKRAKYLNLQNGRLFLEVENDQLSLFINSQIPRGMSVIS